MTSLRSDGRVYLWFAAICTAALVVGYSAVLFDPQRVRPLVLEDGLYESMTALFFIAAALLFAVAWWKQKNLVFALLAIAFLFAGGEEISWGQRLVGYGTPEFFAKNNAQGEFNIHNLKWLHRGEGGMGFPLNPNRAFSLFWALYCVAIPLAVLLSARIASFARQIHLPVVSLWIGLFFPLNYAVAKVLAITLPAEQLATVEGYTEIRECILAFICMAMAADFLRRARARGSGAA